MIEPLVFGQALVEQVQTTTLGDGRLAVWWLGHCGLLLKHGSVVAVVDPYLSDRLTDRGLGPRRSTAPLAANELTGVSLVLITGGSADLFDPATVPALLEASPDALLVLPAGLADVAADEMGVPDERMVPIRAGQLFEIEDLTIHAVGLTEEDEPLRLEYVLASDLGSVYVAGNSLPRRGQAEDVRPFHPEIAFLPIGGRGARLQQRGLPGALTNIEAARLASEIGAQFVVPLSFQMFEYQTADPNVFADHVAATYPELRCRLLELAGRWIYPPEGN